MLKGLPEWIIAIIIIFNIMYCSIYDVSVFIIFTIKTLNAKHTKYNITIIDRCGSILPYSVAIA